MSFTNPDTLKANQAQDEKRALAPPSYSQETEGPPPAYDLPVELRIAGRRVPPLVNVDQLKGHLALLRAFRALRTEVEAGKDPRLPMWTTDVEPERRWAWFVGLAVERFDAWCMNVPTAIPLEQLMHDHLPPTDVLMVFHAYLLNPGWFAEDTARIPELANLKSYSKIFKAYMTSMENFIIGVPSPARISNWSRLTGSAFDPLDAASKFAHRSVRCPNCNGTVDIPYITNEGTGYFQKTSGCKCSGCNLEITKDALAVGKFAADAAKVTGPRVVFAGTLYSPAKLEDTNRALRIKVRIMSAPQFQQSQIEKSSASDGKAWEHMIGKNAQWQMKNIRLFAGSKMQDNGGKLLGRIMSAYVDDKQYSVELCGAVLRQGSFVTKMHELGWTAPGFFDRQEDAVVLQHAVARYHAFLDLTSSSLSSFFVPTLDIDLAWHTHQLMSDQYHDDCVRYVHRYVDHDDKVEEDHLATSFDLTCRAWAARFNVPYVHCGCPLPGDTIGQKMSRLISHHSNQQPAFLVPPDGERAGTHPSDHNAVFAVHHKGTSEANRRKRTEKTEKRRTRQEKETLKGKASPRSRGANHSAAFLCPVPMYYYAPVGACTMSAPGIVGGTPGESGASAGGCGVGGAACASGGCGNAGAGGGCGGGGGGGGYGEGGGSGVSYSSVAIQ